MNNFIIIELLRIDRGESVEIVPKPIGMVPAISPEYAWDKVKTKFPKTHHLAIQEKSFYEHIHGVFQPGAENTGPGTEKPNSKRGRYSSNRTLAAYAKRGN